MGVVNNDQSHIGLKISSLASYMSNSGLLAISVATS